MIFPDREQTFQFFQTSRFPNTTNTLRYNQQIRIQVSFPILHFLAVQFNLSIVRTAGEAHTVAVNKYLFRNATLTQMWPIHINTFLLRYCSFWYKLINSMDKIWFLFKFEHILENKICVFVIFL